MSISSVSVNLGSANTDSFLDIGFERQKVFHVQAVSRSSNGLGILRSSGYSLMPASSGLAPVKLSGVYGQSLSLPASGSLTSFLFIFSVDSHL